MSWMPWTPSLQFLADLNTVRDALARGDTESVVDLLVRRAAQQRAAAIRVGRVRDAEDPG
jgi:hypothetical protein